MGRTVSNETMKLGTSFTLSQEKEIVEEQVTQKEDVTTCIKNALTRLLEASTGIQALSGLSLRNLPKNLHLCSYQWCIFSAVDNFWLDSLRKKIDESPHDKWNLQHSSSSPCLLSVLIQSDSCNIPILCNFFLSFNIPSHFFPWSSQDIQQATGPSPKQSQHAFSLISS